MYTFLDMLTRLAMVVSECSFGAYVCIRRPVGLSATSALVKIHFCLLCSSNFRPFARQWQYKGNNERTKNKEIFTRTWVWGLVLRVCVRRVRVWNVRVTSVHVSTNFYDGCVRCVRWSNVRLVTNDFCLHNTGFKTLIYTASKTFRWLFVMALVSTEKSPTS